MREEHRLVLSEYKLLRRIFGPKRNEVKGENYTMRKLMICIPHQILFR